MNSYQTNVLWLGLILVALNLIVNIGQFKSIVFSGPVTTTQTTAHSAVTNNTPSNQLV